MSGTSIDITFVEDRELHDFLYNLMDDEEATELYFDEHFYRGDE
jgi:hypothetical protein